MAQPIACDICTTSPAVQMLTNLQDGTVLAICAACLPGFYGHSVLAVMDAGQHKGPAGKCQACRRVHERMTTPAAPADVQAAGAAQDSQDPAVTGAGTGAFTDENPVTGDMDTYPAGETAAEP